jgi:hypothetical protein
MAVGEEEQARRVEPAVGSPVAPPADPDGPGSAADRRRNVILLIVVAVALVFVGFGLDALTTGTNGPKNPSRPVRALTVDHFDRTTRRGLGRMAPGHRWVTPRGRWGIEDGEARVVRPAPRGRSMALVAAVADGQVQVRAAAVTPGIGLAFRCQGPANCWLLEAVPRFGTWNIVVVHRGREKVRGNLGTVPVSSGTTIGVRMRGKRLTFLVDGKPVRTIEDGALLHSVRSGLTLGDPQGAPVARWDEFVAAPVKRGTRS